MKSTRFDPLILISTLLLLLSVSGVYAAAANQTTLSKKELKTLLATAKTPAEHQKIAAYYREKARRLSESSAKHSTQVAIYAKNLPFATLKVKQGIPFGLGAPHCRYWAQRDAEAAGKAEAQAIRHEEMAMSAEQKPAL